MTQATKTPHTLLSDRISSELLSRLQRREITSTQAAAELGVSLTHLSRTLSGAGFKKLPSEAVEGRKTASEARAARTLALEKAADNVEKKVWSLEKAALELGCSERTLFRYIKKARQP